MPLQIKEVYIKVTVDTGQGQNIPEQGNTAPGGNGPPSVNNKDIIADCVEQVMEILKEKMEP